MGLKKVLELLHLDKSYSDGIYAVGHRVVHGGENLTQAVIITEDIKKAIKKATPLAPLHNPSNLEGILVAEKLFSCPQVAVFDTAFHSTIPPFAYLYALPYEFYKELALRRYGFHGISYQFLVDQAANHLKKDKEELNIIALHLGAGASMAAIKGGRSIDTTMGVTPLEGLVMATRCGDIDPAICEILSSQKSLSMQEIGNILNRESGIFGICGEKDMRAVTEAAASGSERHKLALEVFVHRIRKYLGAYYVLLEGNVDALIFSAGIGERSALIREMVCAGLIPLGISIDKAKNHEESRGLVELQEKNSTVKILLIPTDEELCIAKQALETVEHAELRSV